MKRKREGGREDGEGAREGGEIDNGLTRRELVAGVGHGSQGASRPGGGRSSQRSEGQDAVLLEHAGSIGSSGKGRKEGSAGRGGEGEEALAGGSTTAGQHHDGDDDDDDDDDDELLLLRISKTLVCLCVVCDVVLCGFTVMEKQEGGRR